MNGFYAFLLLVHTVLILGVLNRLLGKMLDEAEYDIILGIEQRLGNNLVPRAIFPGFGGGADEVGWGTPSSICSVSFLSYES